MRLRGRLAQWARRGVLAGVLAAAVLFPGHLPGPSAPACHRGRCAGSPPIRWIRRLPGSWIAGDGTLGTVPAAGQAYVAADSQVAVVGTVLTVDAFAAATGSPLWSTALSGMPSSSAIVSVRAWPGIVTVGVAVPGAAPGQPPRLEVALNPVTGAQIRAYPAAAYGGAVSASGARTVVVGPGSVTGYANATGHVAWRAATGSAEQGWRVDGGYLYVTVAAQGMLGAAPVTAIRQISLRTGAEQILTPAGGRFAGTLSGAVAGVLLFSGQTVLSGYSEHDGRLLWKLPGAVPELPDLVRQVLYVDIAGRLIGIDPATGTRVRGTVVPGPPGLYGVRDGVALGLDPGAAGSAWGYLISARRIVWSTRQLPWPHLFVDLAGIGGSADPASSTVLLAACADTGAAAAGAGHVCLRPELIAIHR